MTPLVWVVIPTWNRRQDLLSCLASLYANDYVSFQVVVVDNGSSDGTVEAVRTHYPQATLIPLQSNIGATGASNRGFAIALENGAEYVLRLDSDTILAPTALSELVKATQDVPQAGVWTAKIYYCDPPHIIWFAGAYENRWHLGAFGSARSQSDSARTLNPRIVDYAWSTAMLIRVDILRDVGGFDPDFLVYFEEVDFCLRVRAAGYQIMFVPAAHVWHRIGSSAKSATVAYNWNRSKMLLYRKHTYRLHRASLIGYAFCYALAASIATSRMGGNRGPLPDALRGLWDGFRAPLSTTPARIR